MPSSTKQINKIWEKLAIGVIIITLTAFFAPIFKGLVPIPADALVGLYHPYRDFFAGEYPSGIPYKNFLITDPVRQQFVWKKFAIDELKQGRIPWWNPYTFSGTPLLATMQAGVFYPLNLIFWLTDFTSSWTLFILIQPLLGAIFFYAFLRSHQIHPLAAALGAITFVLSGFFTVWLEWGNIGHIILWLPLLLLAVDKIIGRGNLWWQVVFVLALVSQFFAGHLQISFYVLLITVTYLACRLWKVKPSRQKNLLILFIVHFFLFIIITAIQWFPTAQFISLSNRDSDQINALTRVDWFIPWKNLAQLVAPDFFGNPSTLNYWGVWNYAEFVSYIGLVPLTLALFALLKQPSKLSRFFTFTGVIALVLALPTPIAKLPFILNFSFLSQAQPSRLLALTAFSLSVLASMGLDLLIKTKKDKRLWFSLAAVGVALTVLWLVSFGVVGNLNADHQLIAQRNLILPSLLFGVAAFSITTHPFFFQSSRWGNPIVLALTLTLLTSFDLIRFATKFTPFSPKAYIYPITKATSFLQNDPDIFRIMTTDRRLLPPNVTMAYHLQTVEGYDPLYLKTYAQLITDSEAGEKQAATASFNRIVTMGNIDSEMIDKLNVKYILSLNDIDNESLSLVFQEGETRVYENKEVESRARLVKGEGSVGITSYSSSEVIIEAEITSNEATLELADMMYSGWLATIDDTTTTIPLSSPEGFRQVKVPRGNHTVNFHYSPFAVL